MRPESGKKPCRFQVWLDMDGSNRQMQPLYDDPYGILMLVSTEQLDEQTRSLYRSVEVLSKPKETTWFVRFKHWFFAEKNTINIDQSTG